SRIAHFEFVTCSEVTYISSDQILQDISCYWHKVQLLKREMALLKLKFEVEIFSSNSGNMPKLPLAPSNDALEIKDREQSHCVTARFCFFSPSSRSKVYVIFIFRPQDVAVYPRTPDLKWMVSKIYGSVRYKYISQAIPFLCFTNSL